MVEYEYSIFKKKNCSHFSNNLSLMVIEPLLLYHLAYTYSLVSYFLLKFTIFRGQNCLCQMLLNFHKKVYKRQPKWNSIFQTIYFNRLSADCCGCCSRETSSIEYRYSYFKCSTHYVLLVSKVLFVFNDKLNVIIVKAKFRTAIWYHF